MSFVGEEIKHSKYGVGKVLCFEKREKDFLVKIKFANEEKSLIANLMSFKSFVFLKEDKQQEFLYFINSLIPLPKMPEVGEERIKDLLEGKVIGREISYLYGGDLSKVKGFKYKSIYGKNAADIYYKAVKYLNFDSDKNVSFSFPNLLYAKDCTPEGYSVWFLPNSELNGKSNGKWANFIDEKKHKIIQYSFYGDKHKHEKGEKRIVFVKQNSEEYVFLGVYELVKKEYVKYKENLIKEEVFSLWQDDY